MTDDPKIELPEAAKEGWTRRDMHRAARRKKAKRKYGTPEFPKGKFRVICADPPWESHDNEAVA